MTRPRRAAATTKSRATATVKRRAAAMSEPSEAMRVLALLDDSRQSQAALAAAVALADEASAELVALFIEDLDLLRCAAFPFSCEVGASTGLTRPLQSEELRSEEHTSELQSRPHLVCRLLLEKKKNT